MIVVGIDPGANGAIAVLPIYSYKAVTVLPFKDNSLTDIYVYLSKLDSIVENRNARLRAELVTAKGKPKIDTVPDQRNFAMEIWLENPNIIPSMKRDGKEVKMGTYALRRLGERIGEWKGISACLNLEPQLIEPKKWQNALGCRTGGNKKVTREFARKVFPYLEKTQANGKTISQITDSTADALLIALYGYLQYVPRNKLPHCFKSNLPNDISLPAKTMCISRPSKKALKKVTSV